MHIAPVALIGRNFDAYPTTSTTYDAIPRYIDSVAHQPTKKPHISPKASFTHTYSPFSSGINAESSETDIHIGIAHTTGITISIRIVIPGPQLGIIASIPKAPAAVRQ